MALDNLGSSLKNTFRKIAGLGVVDKDTVERIVLDIQRAMLQADVDVQLVSELSESIKKKILKGKPPTGLTLKEYFVKTLYDELVDFLGSEKGEIELKKQRILVVGLFGSGKCVHPESNIILSDGNVISAENLYENYKQCGENPIEDGKIVDVSKKGLFVPSFNPKTLKIENKKATHLWKLKEKNLLEVNLDNGNDFSVKVTPEHPFFVLRKGVLKQIRADELNEDDFVAIPRNHEHKGKLIDLYLYLENLDIWIYDNPEMIKKTILSNYSTLREAHKNLKFKCNYCKFTSLVKRGIAPLQLVQRIHESTFNLKIKNANKPISFPRYFTTDLAEFLGYIIGDGHIEPGYVQICNEDVEIIKRIDELTRSLFGIKPEIKKAKRTKNMYDIRIVSTTLVKLVDKMFGLSPGKKGKQLKIPAQIILSEEDTVRSFLKAYFDCDASLSEGTRQIELTSESRPLISQISSLLLRFNIVSTISKKIINDVPYWRLSIRARYAENYADKIGFKIERKQMRANQYKRIGIRQGCGKQDMIPLANILKEIRQSLGFSIGKIQEYVNSYGQYERYGMISRESLEKVTQLYDNSKQGKMLHILKNINNKNELNKYSQPILNSVISYLTREELISNANNLTFKGTQFINQVSSYPTYQILNFVKCLADSDVCWARVNKIEPYNNKEEYVYDLTVEDNHSFIADNIIVHNTTSIGKLAKWFKTRGLSVGLVACDVHRPAAKDQLEQLGKKIDAKVYREGKKAEDVAKTALKKSKDDVLIFDSAGRDALDKGLAKELTNLGKLAKADEVLLVIPADLGQAARKQAEEFTKLVGITGIIVTKLDGTAKGGGALSAAAATGAKVKFIGVGEKIGDLEQYDPQRFVSRLIGYGDIQGLLEKAKEVGVDEKAAERMAEGKFTLLDFVDQVKKMQGMGSLSSLTGMIPGLSGAKIPKDMLDVQEGKMKKWNHIINSMTPAEREDPDILTKARIERVAKGSGTKPEEVRAMIKNFNKIKKVMKMASGKGLKRGPLGKLIKQMGVNI